MDEMILEIRCNAMGADIPFLKREIKRDAKLITPEPDQLAGFRLAHLLAENGTINHDILLIDCIYYNLTKQKLVYLSFYKNNDIHYLETGKKHTHLTSLRPDLENWGSVSYNELKQEGLEDFAKYIIPMAGTLMLPVYKIPSTKQKEKLEEFIAKNNAGLHGYEYESFLIDIKDFDFASIYQTHCTRKGIKQTITSKKGAQKLIMPSGKKYNGPMADILLSKAIENIGGPTKEEYERFETEQTEKKIDALLVQIKRQISIFRYDEEEYKGYFDGFDDVVIQIYSNVIDVRESYEDSSVHGYKLTDIQGIVSHLQKLRKLIPFDLIKEEKEEKLQTDVEELESYLIENLKDYDFKVNDHVGFIIGVKDPIVLFYLEESEVLSRYIPNTNKLSVLQMIEKYIKQNKIEKLETNAVAKLREAILERFGSEFYFKSDMMQGSFIESMKLTDLSDVIINKVNSRCRNGIRAKDYQGYRTSDIDGILRHLDRLKAALDYKAKDAREKALKEQAYETKITMDQIAKTFPKLSLNQSKTEGRFPYIDEVILTVDNGTIQILDSFESNSYSTFQIKDRRQISNHIKSLKETTPKRYKEYEDILSSAKKMTFKEIYELKDSFMEMPNFFQTMDETKIFTLRSRKNKEKAIEYAKRIHAVDYPKVQNLLDSIHACSTTYDQQKIDKIFENAFELSKDEESLVKEQLDQFNMDNLDIRNVSLNCEGKRRVYIKKSLIKEYKSFDRDIQESINQIVHNMRTLDGLPLLAYLRNRLQMNEPKDHSHKVRIPHIRDRQRRMCFWQGKDFTDRPESMNDFYIFYFVEEHDQDIEHSKTFSPSKYVEDDFEIFTLDQKSSNYIRIPELRPKQFRLASALDGPKVIYGCAGSGKTLVSVDQYWQIQSVHQLDGQRLAYITFQEALRKNADDMIKSLGVTPYTYTLPDFFRMLLRIEEKQNITGEAEFLDWYNDYYVVNGKKYERYKDIQALSEYTDADRIVYTYFRGIYKGSKTLSYTHNSFMTFEEFHEELNTREEFLSEQLIKELYTVCEKYRSYMDENHMMDDNDLALQVVVGLSNNKSRRMDYLLIDEVQDLTPLQIHAILLCLSKESQNIFFYGDPHQTVNPTLFDKSILNMAVLERLGTELKVSKDLDQIYRTNKNLKRFLVELQRKRQEYLGKYMDDIGRIPEEVKDDDKEEKRWAAYTSNKELEQYILNTAFDKGAVLIIPDEKHRIEIERKYPYIDQSRVFTIYQAKGMEWDKAILYHMISSGLSIFKDLIRKEAKKNTIARMFFNKFYVACTRARETFILLEDEMPEEITNTLLESLPPLEEASQADLYLGEDATFDDWIFEANRYLANQDYKRAFNPILQARQKVKTEKEAEIVTDLLRKCRIKEGSHEELLRYGNEAYNKKQYASAEEFYFHAKEFPMADLARMMQGIPIKKPEYMERFMKLEMHKKHPECLPYLVKDPLFQKRLKQIHKKLFGGA